MRVREKRKQKILKFIKLYKNILNYKKITLKIG